MKYSIAALESRLKAIQKVIEASQGGIGKVHYRDGRTKTVPVREMMKIIKTELDTVAAFECDPQKNGMLQELLNGLIEGEA